MNRPLLYSQDHEEAILGAAMLSRTAAEVALAHLVPSDFAVPSHAATFEAIGQLYRDGASIEPLTVRGALERAGATQPSGGELVALQAAAPGLSADSVASYASVVAEFALRRRGAAEATALQHAMYDLTKGPGQVIDEHRTMLAGIDSSVLARSPGDLEVSEFIRQEDEATLSIVPGLLTEDDRAIVVAEEGLGKSEFLRQIAMTVAYGIHPFCFTTIPPSPTLLVDLENPRTLVRKRLRHLTMLAARSTGAERATAHLWHRPGGIDLRRRSSRLELEDVIRRRQPRLVVLGPLYKAYARRGNETDEQVTSEVQSILDDLRTRFRFALVAEHHAPQGNNGSRDLRPFGSSLWLRWPEFGLRLRAHPERPKQVVLVERWRGDRSRVNWPDELHRGPVWPWEGRWFDGRREEPDSEPAF